MRFSILRGVILLLSLISSPALAQPASPDADGAAPKPSLLSREMVRLLTTPTGPPEPEWSTRGVDQDGLFAGQGDGPQLLFDKSAPATITAGGLEIDQLIPAGWRRMHARAEDEVSGLDVGITVMRLTSTRLLAVLMTGGERIGTSSCTGPNTKVSLVHYEKVGARAVKPGLIGGTLVQFYDEHLPALAKLPVCTAVVDRGAGNYEIQPFNRDGQPLGKLKSSALKQTLHPVSRLSELFRLAR